MDQFPVQIRRQRFADLDPVVAYRLWALRSEVFVVEQGAAYLDLDGGDTESGTWHLWCADDAGMPVATLRVLDDDGGWRVGRVATARSARGRGLAAAMMREVVATASDRTIVLDAQTQLRDWYAAFGFVVTGAEYADEDGIPHVPMRREAGSS
ncbi:MULTISPECIES: GNAT family N-acetyltransferase [unclassified Knoellia]|uniref:GNAT family N-acetyltransferase n=1 Tax=Knoellia altitudinis TaxID=3404795 RepID=UPI0036131A8B